MYCETLTKWINLAETTSPVHVEGRRRDFPTVLAVVRRPSNSSGDLAFIRFCADFCSSGACRGRGHEKVLVAEQGCSSPGGNGVCGGEELLRDRWIPISSRRVSPFMDRISNNARRWNPS